MDGQMGIRRRVTGIMLSLGQLSVYCDYYRELGHHVPGRT